ncbi:Uncharacterised protein [uncultured Blautia sp.]|nr:Uncharacterised protein [uncultured Blautia sp.]
MLQYMGILQEGEGIQTEHRSLIGVSSIDGYPWITAQDILVLTFGWLNDQEMRLLL